MDREAVKSGGDKCREHGPEPHRLLIYIEPAPYIIGLVREIEDLSAGKNKVIFLHMDLTQPWGIDLSLKYISCLSENRWKAFCEIFFAVIARPHVLHLAGWSHPLMLFALLLAKMLRVPVTVESDTQLPFQLAWWKRVVKSLVYPWLFRRFDGFFPGGTRQGKYLSHYRVPESKIRSAQMTVDVELIQKTCQTLGPEGRTRVRNQFGISNSVPMFVFIGRLIPCKGISDMLQAFERLTSEAVLVIVGDGPEMGRVTSAARCNPAIHSTGRLEQEEVIEMLNAADAIVIPSHLDAWGLVINEAMAAGLPVIASERVGAVDDLVKDGETGIVFNCGDIDGLARAMQVLADDSALRKRYAEAGQKLIAGWTLSDSAHIMLRGWRQIIQERGR